MELASYLAGERWSARPAGSLGEQSRAVGVSTPHLATGVETPMFFTPLG
jgi:hypothetical protein